MTLFLDNFLDTEYTFIRDISADRVDGYIEGYKVGIIWTSFYLNVVETIGEASGSMSNFFSVFLTLFSFYYIQICKTAFFFLYWQ